MEAFRRTLRATRIQAPQELQAPPDSSQPALWILDSIIHFRESLPPVQGRIFDLILGEDDLSCVARVLNRDKKQIRQAILVLRKELRIFLTEYPRQRQSSDRISEDAGLRSSVSP